MSAVVLTEGPVGRHLINLTTPMLIGIAMMMGQTLLDSWFLGQIGDRELAAHAFGFPVLLIVSSVAIGLGAGTSSVVARAIGRGDRRRTRRLATDSLILSFSITVIIAIIGIATIDPLFTLMGAPADMLPLISGFMILVYSGVPFIVVGMVGLAAIRATGNAKLPGKLMVVGSIVNVIISPVLIFGAGPLPELGLNGAAIAGLISRGMVFIGAVWFMYSRFELVSFSRPRRVELFESWKDILHVGIPAAGTNMIIPIGTALVTAMIAQYGPDAVAGFGVASRIESLCLVIFYAMSSIIGPFVGQNFAAGLEDRVHRSLNLSALACLAIGLGLALLLALGAGVVPGLFSESSEIQAVIRQYLWIVPLSYGTYGIVMVINAAFNGLGRPMPGVWVSTGRIIVLYLPLAWVGGQMYGVIGIFAAYAAANVITGLLGFIWARRIVTAACAQHREMNPS